jgi:hypothetical protein
LKVNKYPINNYSAPRLKLMFEIGKDYVMLINNNEKEFSHFVNRKLKFDQILIEFRNCGILLNPLDEDLQHTNYRAKVNIYN